VDAQEFLRDTAITFRALLDGRFDTSEFHDSARCPRSGLLDEQGRIRGTSREEDDPQAADRGLNEHATRGNSERAQ